MSKPTGRELLLGDSVHEYKCVSGEIDGKWRHGTEHCDVYHRPEDNTYWQVLYRCSTNEGIEWDSGVDVSQVRPVEETVVVRKWKPVTENSNA